MYAASIPTGGVPRRCLLSRRQVGLCVSNAADDDVSIIDVKARLEVARLKVGRVPKRLVAASVPGGEPAKQSPSK